MTESEKPIKKEPVYQDDQTDLGTEYQEKRVIKLTRRERKEVDDVKKRLKELQDGTDGCTYSIPP